MRRPATRLILGLIAMAALAGAWLLPRPSARAAAPQPAHAQAAQPAVSIPHAASWAGAASTPARIAPAAAPPDADPLQSLPPEERAALAAALQGHPDRDAEMRRVAGFLQLQHQVQAWAAARAAQVDPALRRELAARIESTLPDVLAAQRVTAGEALQLQSALIAEREPDADRAETELAAWRARHLRTAAGPDSRERAFLAQQQALVAAYRQKPEQLEPALEALRRQHFATSD